MESDSVERLELEESIARDVEEETADRLEHTVESTVRTEEELAGEAFEKAVDLGLPIRALAEIKNSSEEWGHNGHMMQTHTHSIGCTHTRTHAHNTHMNNIMLKHSNSVCSHLDLVEPYHSCV